MKEKSGILLGRARGFALLFFVAAGIPACTSLTEEQELLVARAKALDTHPFDRANLVSELGLETTESERFGGLGGINGSFEYTESWTHSSGLTIEASYWKQSRAVKRSEIDEILNNPNRAIPIPPGGFPAPSFPERPVAARYSISKGNKVHFTSRKTTPLKKQRYD